MRQRGVLTVLEPPVRPNRPLADRELFATAARQDGKYDLVMTALNLSNGTTVEQDAG